LLFLCQGYFVIIAQPGINKKSIRLLSSIKMNDENELDFVSFSEIILYVLKIIKSVRSDDV